MNDFSRALSRHATLDESSLSKSLRQQLAQLTIDQGVAVLNGDSGSGKTLAAELIANKLNTRILKIDSSKLLNSTIGETEKNIDQLLSRAQDKNWILFFDEADALFGKRTEVKDSHDRYANQEVSYLLQKIADYKGLAILSTNLKNDVIRQLDNRFTLVSMDD